MSIKGIRSILRTTLIFFLVVAMIAPQTTWAVTERTEEAEDIAEPTIATSVTPEPSVIPKPSATPAPSERARTTSPASVTEVPLREEQGQAKTSTGWIRSGSHTFYTNKSGKLLLGWQKIDNYYYYFNKTGGTGVKGRMLTGWRKIGGKTYYFETSGVAGVQGRMKAGWATIGSDSFYFNKKNGVLVAGGWQKIDKNWYYLEPTGGNGRRGRVSVGWRALKGKTYYFSDSNELGVRGRMFTGRKKIGSHSYYFGGKSDGTLKTGWQTIGKKKYYFRPKGAVGVKGRALTSWHKIGGKLYCFSASTKATERGRMLTGWQQVGNHRYLLNASGQPRVGWQKIGKNWYHFAASGSAGTLGRLSTGWKTISGKTYYFRDSGNNGVRGRMFTGIKTVSGRKYYFGGSSDGVMKTGFRTISGSKYYFSKSGKADGTKGQMLLGWQTISGSEYYFYMDTGKMAFNVTIDGVYINKDGKAVKDAQVVVGGSGQKTIKSFLRSAMQPVGSTLYIWGGGHDAWSKGGDGVRAGVNPNWKKFYDSQKSTYNYDSHRFKHGSGLDCSGFVGWSAYNAIESKSNVMSTGSATTSTSTGMPAKYASNGWGKNNYTSAGKFTPGDVVSMSGHVWIVLGQCQDGSVVIIHSTPQAGVQIAGTPTPAGSSSSQAIALAQTYMKRYYPGIVSKFKLSSIVSRSYLTKINRFRWDVTGKKLMRDPEGYLSKTPEQILKDIFGE